MSEFDFSDHNAEQQKLLAKSGRQPIEHVLFDTRLLARVDSQKDYKFFQFPIGTEQDGRIKTDSVTNMYDAHHLPRDLDFLLNRIVIVADVVPLCSVNFTIGCRQYENGHIGRFHKKVGYDGCELRIWRIIPALTNFYIDLRFDRDSVAQDVYEIRAELHGLIYRPNC